MKTQTKTKEERKTLILISLLIGFIVGIFFGMAMVMTSPECSEKETITEVLKYECDEVSWSMNLCFGSEPEDCLPTNGSFPLCKETPYEKQIIKEIKK